MRRNIFISFILIAALLLGGCSFGGDLSAMLTPPAMSVGQEALTGAIRAAIGESYELVYPQAGPYRTGIISVDLTGDERNEAVCFYRALSKGAKLRFLVMENQGESWSVLARGESEASSVGRVAFGDIDGRGAAELIVGWQYLTEADGSFDIYTLEDGSAVSCHTGLYSRVVVLEGNPGALVVISRNAESRAVTASLIGKQQGGIGVVNTVAMNDRAVDYLAVEAGRIKGDLPAVFVDEQLEGGQSATEVLVINEQGRLANELINQVNMSTLRYTAVTCRDVNHDERAEVPTEVMLPSYMRNGVSENQYLIQWNSYDGQQLEPVSQAFINVTENFSLSFTKEWEGKITIERPADRDRAYQFKSLKGELLFTVQVYGLAEYSEELGRQGWRKLYTDSDRVYTVYCEEENSFGITYTQIYGLFDAIS